MHTPAPSPTPPEEVGGSEAVPGLYVCGWAKRGPTGIIGTNSLDADETVESIVRDAPRPSRAPGAAGLRALLAARGAAPVDFGGWRRIDAAEVAAGAAVGKPREKIVAVDAMLAAAGVGNGGSGSSSSSSSSNCSVL